MSLNLGDSDRLAPSPNGFSKGQIMDETYVQPTSYNIEQLLAVYKRKKRDLIYAKKGRIAVDELLFSVIVLNRDIIGVLQCNPTTSLDIIQTENKAGDARWWIQVANETEVWKATMHLFMFLRIELPVNSHKFEVDNFVLKGENMRIVGSALRQCDQLKMAYCEEEQDENGIKYILENFTAMKAYTHGPDQRPPMDKLERFDSVHFKSPSSWMTLENVLATNFHHLELGHGKDLELNIVHSIIERWMSDYSKKWHIMRVSYVLSTTAQFPQNKWVDRKRPRYIRYYNPFLGFRMNIDGRYGTDYYRDDGKVVTVIRTPSEGKKWRGYSDVVIYFWDLSCDWDVSPDEYKELDKFFGHVPYWRPVPGELPTGH